MSIPPHYEDTFEVDGVPVTIRTMRAEDRDNEQQFVSSLSRQTSYYRFHGTLRELSPEWLYRFTHPDYPVEMALVAVVPDGDGLRQIGVARYVRLEDPTAAELAIVVADAWQGKGVGTRMLKDLRECALEAGIERMQASVLSENRRMRELCRHLGFETAPSSGDRRNTELGKKLRSDPEEPRVRRPATPR